MLKVMIIDDDRDVRDRLKSIIDWDGLNLSLSCEAGDSEAAMEFYLLHRPKIIITDIHIPIISGLELARKLLEQDKEIRFIVITGYNNFEFVRDSVALGAVDLLSKPLSAKGINDSLRKAADYFEGLQRERASTAELSRLVEENLPQLRESFMAYLLTNPEYSEPYVSEERLSSLRLDIRGDLYSVVIVGCSMRNAEPGDVEKLQVAMRYITEDLLLDAGFKRFTFFDENYRLNCVVSWTGQYIDGLLEEVITNVHEKMQFVFGREIFAGIGQPVPGLKDLHTSARQAMVAYNYQGVLGSESVIDYKNIKRLDAPVETDRIWLFDRLEKYFRMNNTESLFEYLQNHITYIATNAADSLLQTKAFAFEYIATIVSVSLSMGIGADIVPMVSNVLSDVFSCSDIPSLMRYIRELTEKLLADIFSNRLNKQNQLITLAKNHIDENLGNKDLDLDSVSYHIGLSSKYFCRLFHKEEGISFSQYLNKRRIDLAKDMLKNTGKKVFEICYELGYGNPKYFSFVFKRMTGLTPLEFRNSGEPGGVSN